MVMGFPLVVDESVTAMTGEQGHDRTSRSPASGSTVVMRALDHRTRARRRRQTGRRDSDPRAAAPAGRGRPPGHREAARGGRAGRRPVWRTKYGDPLDLLLVGDSIAAGLGPPAIETLGGQVARALAGATRRSVRLRTVARVGASPRCSPSSWRPAAGVPARRRGGRRRGNDCDAPGARGPSPRRTWRTRSPRCASSRRGRRRRHLPGPGCAAWCRNRCGRWGPASRQLALAQGRPPSGPVPHRVAGPGGRAVLHHQPDEMFSLDRFHPSAVGYQRTAEHCCPRCWRARRPRSTCRSATATRAAIGPLTGPLTRPLRPDTRRAGPESGAG